MEQPVSDLTALIARADDWLAEAGRFMAVSHVKPSPTVHLVRDLRDALTVAEARCRAVEQERDAAREQVAVDFEALQRLDDEQAAQATRADAWKERADAAEQALALACCPVCQGKRLVPAGFYSAIGVDSTAVSDLTPERCRTCCGLGYVTHDAEAERRAYEAGFKAGVYDEHHLGHNDVEAAYRAYQHARQR